MAKMKRKGMTKDFVAALNAPRTPLKQDKQTGEIQNPYLYKPIDRNEPNYDPQKYYAWEEGCDFGRSSVAQEIFKELEKEIFHEFETGNGIKILVLNLTGIETDRKWREIKARYIKGEINK